MIDDVGDIASYYDSHSNKEHIRLEEHKLEFELTWRYLDRYLPAQGHILEIGAATGRYTLELVKRGCMVTAVDLSASEIEICSERLVGEGLEGRARLVVADARNLGEVTERDFDAVLLMGPLYHLIEEGDRKAALKEAVNRLQEGGLLFSAFLSRFGLMSDLIRFNPAWIEDQTEVQSILERGRRPDDYPRGGFRGYFARAEEIPPLHEAIGLETLTLAGVDPVIAADDESYNRLQGKMRQLWLDLCYEIGKERSILGASRHLLYIGQKYRSNAS